MVKTTILSRGNPRIRAVTAPNKKGEMIVKRMADVSGACDACGQTHRLYQFGYEPKKGRRRWTAGEYCTLGCWRSR